MIRSAQSKDIQAIYQLICHLENTIFDYDTFQIHYEMLLKHNENYLFVYEQEHQIVAFMSVIISLQLHHNAYIAEIRELIIDPTCRNQQIGKKMWVQAKQLAQEKNCVRLELSSNQKRTDAHRFYKRLGMNQSHYSFTLDL